jgi:hypothetical protein
LPNIHAVAASQNAAGNTSFSPVQPIGHSTSTYLAPSVGYSLGRTWLGFRRELTTIAYLYAQAIDSLSGTPANDTFTETATNPMDTRMVVATQTSGGTPSEVALAVWCIASDITALRLRNYGHTGTYTSFGGGCGNAGTQSFSHQPGIGSSALRCTLAGLPPTALATVFNFAAGGGVPLPCGPCVWVPFAVTQTRPIAAGSAWVQFPIPCLQSLVGIVFETQWTSIDFTQTPCGLAPGLVLSDRMAMTIGQ